MRFLMTLISLSLAACSFGASRGRTTTTFVDDPGYGPVHRQTYSTESNGVNVGGNVPFAVLGGGMYGGGMTMGGGNTACVLHPDYCAGVYSVTVVQPTTIVSHGGYAGGTSYDGSGQAATADTDDAALEAMLAKHERAIAALVGGLGENVRRVCQVLIANPETIEDPDDRKQVIAACQDRLGKHPNAKSAAKKEAK